MTAIPLKLYDSLRQKKLEFQPRAGNRVTIYCCGPTVYGLIHIGNCRPPIVLDLLARTLRGAGFDPHVARNYTDIDDKIIAVAQKNNESADQVAARFTETYEREMKALKIVEPQHKPKATQTISEMIQMIEGLQKKGLAYPVKTSFGTDMYFRVSEFKDYGKLSKRKIDDMIAGNRIDVDEKKEHPADFALWKASKPGEPSWETPWGAGRPGWHLECSAMIEQIFPEGLDIHMGGIDLLFPHHENEIAQSEGLKQKPLASFWIHNGLLEFGQAKMSKSLGNLVLAHEFFTNYGADVLRILMLQAHYRSPLDASDENFERAESMLQRLYVCKEVAEKVAIDSPSEELPPELQRLTERCEEALLDDLNSAKALGYVLSAARVCFRTQKPSHWAAWKQIISWMNDRLGLLEEIPSTALAQIFARRLHRFGMTEKDAKEIDLQLKERERLRAEKNFAAGDQIRKNLESRGVIVMDGPDGTAWSMKRGV